MKQVEIISFHPGRQHNFEQALQISKRFAGFKHLTSLYFNEQLTRRIGKISSKAANALEKRTAPVESRFVDINPIPELKLLLNRNAGKKLSGVHYQKRNELFQKWVLKKYGAPKICIGYDTSSWLVFEQWEHKSFLILDLSIATPQYKLHLAKEQGFSQPMIDKLTEGDNITSPVYEKELALADMILCGSESVKGSCIAAGVDPAKLVILPYGTDLNRFLVAKNWQKDPGTIKIAFVGSFGYRKGADVLLKVWDRIRASFPNVELHVYGGVQVDLPENKERIFFHGFISQDALIQELQNAQISVLPTFFEGSSLAVFQSMALGLAVVTTPNSGSVIQDGKNGLIVPYGSEAALYNGLMQLLDDAVLRNRLAMQAQEDVQQYTWDAYGKKLNHTLAEILSGNALCQVAGQEPLFSDDHL